MIRGKKLTFDSVVLVKKGQHIKVVSSTNPKEEDVLYIDSEGVVNFADIEFFTIDEGLEIV